MTSMINRVFDNNYIYFRCEGVLGTTTSQTTKTVANLLSDTNIPHFGISATMPSLSNKTVYPTFYRTVPSDLTQSKVNVDLCYIELGSMGKILILSKN